MEPPKGPVRVPEAVVPRRQSRLKNIVGGSAGNLVEWFDWYVYGAFALYFAPAFFPQGDRTAQLLQTAAIFAVGFLMRPVGAWRSNGTGGSTSSSSIDLNTWSPA